MEPKDIRDGVLAMWRRNNEILLFLLAQITVADNLPSRAIEANGGTGG